MCGDASTTSAYRGAVPADLVLACGIFGNVSDEDIQRAARDACIHEEISQRDKGYESTVIEGGCNFSAGQRQRLELARALAQNPNLLILDEATSALDSETEAMVMDKLRKRGCACSVRPCHPGPR